MNKQLIQNILYAGHCIGICSDWSEQAVNNIIDKLKDDDFVYNKDEAVMDSYERGFMQGKTKGVEEIIDKACETYKNVLKRHFGIDKFNSRLHDMEVLIGKFRDELSN